MQILRLTPNDLSRGSACAVAIGNFDGVHRGHQALVSAVVAGAALRQLVPAVLTFEPTPLEFLRPAEAPARVMRLRDKAQTLAQLGIKRLYLARFDARLQSLSAARFETWLRTTLNARHVVVGAGFHYAQGREGTVERLRQAGQETGFSLQVIEPVCVDQQRVSSTRLRQALAAGQLREAQAMMGRPFCISGHVVHGQKLGRTLGFPTANLRLGRGKVPLSGIYAVRAHLDGAVYPAVASLGTRPTVDGVEPLLETTLFDFSGDLYGRLLSIEFVEKLRDEERFSDLDALVVQMNRDAAKARTILAAMSP